MEWSEISKLWDELGSDIHEVMKELGYFSPTVKGDSLKGYMCDEKTYWDAKDLRRIAEACLVAAEFLDRVKR